MAAPGCHPHCAWLSPLAPSRPSGESAPRSFHSGVASGDNSGIWAPGRGRECGLERDRWAAHAGRQSRAAPENAPQTGRWEKQDTRLTGLEYQFPPSLVVSNQLLKCRPRFCRTEKAHVSLAHDTVPELQGPAPEDASKSQPERTPRPLRPRLGFRVPRSPVEERAATREGGRGAWTLHGLLRPCLLRGALPGSPPAFPAILSKHRLSASNGADGPHYPRSSCPRCPQPRLSLPPVELLFRT